MNTKLELNAAWAAARKRYAESPTDRRRFVDGWIARAYIEDEKRAVEAAMAEPAPPVPLDRAIEEASE